jgi:hypothetical protein
MVNIMISGGILYTFCAIICILFASLHDNLMMVAEATETCRWIIYDKTYTVWCAFGGLLHSLNSYQCIKHEMKYAVIFEQTCVPNACFGIMCMSLVFTYITDRNVVLCDKTCSRMDRLDLSATRSYSLLVQITTADRLIEWRFSRGSLLRTRDRLFWMRFLKLFIAPTLPYRRILGLHLYVVDFHFPSRPFQLVYCRPVTGGCSWDQELQTMSLNNKRLN